MLYVVPTPIGNLSDFTYRAVEVLNAVDYILAEDTRVSAKLLKHYEIRKPLKAFHAHNEHKALIQHIEALKSGQNIVKCAISIPPTRNYAVLHNSLLARTLVYVLITFMC